ncbi:MAG: nucleoside monophosphate kinase [Candidatus Staskawiczbacteria bacterium]|nr:nucleoside monophosphate kinase [Candidatus Staskawiczbacteria bacterium]
MKQVIILFGPPGAGKGTQAELLADKLGYHHFETSKVLEATFREEKPDRVFKIEGQDYKVEDEKNKWEQGLLCSPPFVVFLTIEKIKELAQMKKSIILSGSPRNVFEAEREIPLLKGLYGENNIKFILLEIKAETTIFRNSNRKICELMRHPILFNKETEKLTQCPLDGSKLVKRKGLDDPKVIKKRLEVFREQTFPVLEHIKKEGLSISKVNGEQTVSDVFEDVLKAVK